MKNLKPFIILFLGLFIFMKSFAATISVKEAELVAKNFILETSKLYYENKDLSTIHLELVKTKRSENSEPYYYMFNIKPEGFIIVSAETAFNPILGYNFSGIIDTKIKNTVFESWMQYYEGYIDYIRNNKLSQTKKMKEKWEKYNTTSFDYSKITPKDNIAPLLTNKWNQDYPYNYYCPEDEDGPGGHVYAGCVATAMSMIMYHYKYPKQGTGTHSYYAYPYGSLSVNFGETEYNWDAMDDEINSTSNTQSILAIAQLQYHCGVSVNMGYAADGSGSFSFRVPGAVDSYFGYHNAQYVQKSTYSLSQWNNLLTNQLENGHPMYYSGTGSEYGHAFCLDGKQGEDMFHFNFGWSGYQNGFFYLEGDGAVGGFNSSQAAVINFYPPENEYPYECTEKTVNTCGGVIDDQGFPYESYATNANCKWLLVPESAQDSITKFNFEFLHLNLEEGDKVIIYDGATEDSPLIGEYTGTSLPSNFSSTNDSVLVVFNSNGNETDHDGFRLRYKAKHPKFCLGTTTYTEPQGVISDGSESFNYSNSNICQYMIKPPFANNLTLTFNKFDLAEGDNILIYQTNPTQQIAELTHESNPTSFTSTTGSMMVVFKTDAMFSADGFEASYIIDNINVEDIENISKFELYPNPANDKITLNMLIKNEKSVNVSIHNIDGKVIANDVIKNMAGTFYKEFDVSNLIPGVYLMIVETSKEKTTQRFIVK